MIIIRLNGGLGNQMFQIALGKKFEKLGKKVQFDIGPIESRIEVKNMTKSYEVFDLDLDVATFDNICKLSDMKNDLCSRIRRKIFGYKKTYYAEKKFGDEDKKLYLFNDVYLDGYWQSANYFEDCRDSILNLYKFNTLNDTKNKYYENKINSSMNSVSIHFRLGDYGTKENIQSFGNICTSEYYSKGIKYFQEKFKNVIFFVFSNEFKYIEKYYNKEKFVIVNCNDEKNAWKDMYLMSICKHNIIANSSFSWWGAWLNRNINKTVIAPKKWINGREMKKVCPSNWLRF